MKRVISPSEKSRFYLVYKASQYRDSGKTRLGRHLYVEPHIFSKISEYFVDSEGRIHNPKNDEYQWIPLRDSNIKEVNV